MANDRGAGFADSLLEGPVGCAVLLTIDRDRVSLADALAPRQAFARAATALRALNPWSPGVARARELALAAAPRLAALARDIARHPAAEWWWMPLARERQVQFTPGFGAAIGTAGPPVRSPTPWELYAQRPEGWLLTSTQHDGVTSADAIIALGGGDWSQGLPRLRKATSVNAAARVLEIADADDWHTLCTAYPAVNRDPQSPAGAGTLSPDWALVSAHWDGVHLTFGGLLCAPFVRRESTAGATMLWSWDCEGTMWLRRDALTLIDEPIAPPPGRDAFAVTGWLDLA